MEESPHDVHATEVLDASHESGGGRRADGLSDSIRVIFYARHYGERYQKVTSSADDGSYPSSSRKIVLHQVLSHDGMQHYSAELAIVAACNVFTFNATSEPNATL